MPSSKKVGRIRISDCGFSLSDLEVVKQGIIFRKSKSEIRNPKSEILEWKNAMESLLKDVRYGIRGLLKRPGDLRPFEEIQSQPGRSTGTYLRGGSLNFSV
ncbi:MAG: hypothetical protein ABR568_22420 [Pyrinomonadaceae bacterium]